MSDRRKAARAAAALERKKAKEARRIRSLIYQTSGHETSKDVVSYRDLVDDPNVPNDIDGTNLLLLVSGFFREIDGRRFSPHFNSMIASFIPCCIFKGHLDDNGTSYTGFSWYRNRYAYQLRSDTEHVFGIIALCQSAIVTTKCYKRKKNKGGKLFLRSLTDLVISKDCHINLTGKGYERGYWVGCTGGSVDHGPIRFTNSDQYFSNGGAGGPGYSAGYGTKGKGQYGGEKYGDKYLTTLHLGSGGGCDMRRCRSHVAGEGGGAVKIETYNFVLNGDIEVNGNAGNCYGSGSGGSIHIRARHLKIGASAKIEAVGGHSHQHKSGNGRIRLETGTKIRKNVLERVKPRPFVG